MTVKDLLDYPLDASLYGIGEQYPVGQEGWARTVFLRIYDKESRGDQDMLLAELEI